ncbi:MAG TPA: hypothetical protein VEC35_22225 [Noviherbaspirillum sp.]|nr:hypothetical protein [Noviherbaspirillum sp.]
MINRCKQVQLDDAEPGMVLFEAVMDAQRTVLLPEATVLTDSMLRSLERRGVEYVFVVDDDISQEAWEAECRRVQERLDRLFRQSRGKGASDTLMQSIFEYRTGRGT